MSRAILCLWALGWGLLAPTHAGADVPVSVVTTIPVLKDLVQQVGRSHVHVISLLTGLENEHSYSPKPSDLVAIRKARLFVEIGAGLEVWVGGLIRSASNRELVLVTVSQGIDLIDADPVPRHGGPSEAAHGHHAGNPHIWLDPENAALIVRRIADSLSRVDPSHAKDYAHAASAYLSELDRTTVDLVERLRPFSNRRIVTHHPAWPYFARRFQLQIVGEILTQSGAEPSPRHLRSLIELIRRDGVQVIVSEPQLNQKLPRLVAEESGARLVVLTALPGGMPGTDSYLDMLRYNVLQLVRAFERA